MEERRARLRLRTTDAGRRDRIRRFLEREIWARIPADQLGHAPTKEEREGILAYGDEGV